MKAIYGLNWEANHLKIPWNGQPFQDDAVLHRSCTKGAFFSWSAWSAQCYDVSSLMLGSCCYGIYGLYRGCKGYIGVILGLYKVFKVLGFSGFGRPGLR